MAVRVIPTLEAMADVYRLPVAGGASSPRFAAYVELGRRALPVSGYNPMTGKDALGTVEALLAVDAEALVQRVAESWAAVLGQRARAVSVTVATPGMWTDRLATDVEHRLLGRTASQVVLWAGEPVSESVVVAAATAQLVRLAWITAHGPPATLADAAGQEGLAAHAAGTVAGTPDGEVAEALEVLADDPALATMVAVLHGDDAAQALGWTPLGLGTDTGLRHAAAVAGEALRDGDVGALVGARWSPARLRA